MLHKIINAFPVRLVLNVLVVIILLFLSRLLLGNHGALGLVHYPYGWHYVGIFAFILIAILSVVSRPSSVHGMLLCGFFGGYLASGLAYVFAMGLFYNGVLAADGFAVLGEQLRDAFFLNGAQLLLIPFVLLGPVYGVILAAVSTITINKDTHQNK